jgi:NADH-quinone oxidoreductase subunit L
MAASVAIAGLGIWLGVTLYRGSFPFAVPEAVAARFPRLYRAVYNKYYVDELYEWLFVERLGKRFSRFLWEVDARVVDGLVNGSRHVTVGVSHVSSWFDRVFVDGLVNGVAATFQAAWRGYGRLQSGQTQGYALAMAFGVFGLVCVYLILG